MTESTPEPRKGMPSTRLDREGYRQRFLSRFQDPAFAPLAAELERIEAAAWDGYRHERKSPVTRKAGPGFADPDYDLAVDWIAAKDAVDAAQKQHDETSGGGRVLIVNGSSRSEHSCPGEMSKSWRLTEIARDTLELAGLDVDVLDLSRLTSEFGAQIHPCKACFSTSAALCHWPCSCYPNYSLGQVHDLMNDIYPMWVRAHGVLLVTPVNWYYASSSMKLMIDRLVCADGGNGDPTSTHGKKAKEAKALELEGWDYPHHLKGRLFGIVVHGDSEGKEAARRALGDWLRSMELEPAGNLAELDRYIGYWEPYATSHDALDKDAAVQEEVRNVARTLAQALHARHAGKLVSAGADLEPPREK